MIDHAFRAQTQAGKTHAAAIDMIVPAVAAVDDADPSPSARSPSGAQPKQDPHAFYCYVLPGIHLWEVQLDGGKARWALDYPYGAFPVDVPGTLLWFRRRLYVLERCWSNSLVVTTPNGALPYVQSAHDALPRSWVDGLYQTRPGLEIHALLTKRSQGKKRQR